MNKHERRVKGATKQKRRINIWTRNGKITASSGIQHKLKTMSTPCSCTVCSPRKIEKTKPTLQSKLNECAKIAKLEVHEFTSYFGITA